jgi:moderate conductance mechanosensitive channel
MSELPDWLHTLLASPVLIQGFKLLVVLALFLGFRIGMRVSMRQAEQRIESTVMEADRRRRLHTLLRAGYGTGIVIVTVIVLIMSLQLLGLRIEPLLASAGVAGLAISLGAQTLIKDYIGGALILAEDQFRVGDVVDVNGVAGEVVRMTLRVTYLRNVEGKLITVPNGEIRTITNMTRDWSRAVVDLNLAFGADHEHVRQVLQQAAQRLSDDPDLRDSLLEPPEILSWNGTNEWSIQVRLMVKTVPGKQWAVSRALRQLALEALRVEGLSVALPVALMRDRTT